MPALILFDVDGTLLVTGGATTRCIWKAAEATFGHALERCPLTAGRLDQQLFLDIATHCGITDAARQLQRYKSLYLHELEHELLRTREQVKVMPGVVPLLEDLSRRPEQVIIGLLTGNFRQSTMLKLRFAGLDRFAFPVGAFAEDGNERAELVGHALDQYERVTAQKPDPSQVIIVGDTPRDIATAHQMGCRVLSVATGTYSLEQLKAEKPDAVVQNLLEPQPLFEILSIQAFRKDREM